MNKFERYKDPKTIMGIGFLADLDRLAEQFGLIKTDGENIDPEYFEDFDEYEDTIIQVWQQYCPKKKKYYDGLVILYKDSYDDLLIASNSMDDFEIWEYETWLKPESWEKKFK